MNRYWFICLIFFCLLSCHDADRERMVEDLIQVKVKQRLDQFSRVSLQDCEKNLMNDAVRMVDSMLRLNPILIKLDSLQRPPKPEKPAKPAFAKPNETEALKPIDNRKKKSSSSEN